MSLIQLFGSAADYATDPREPFRVVVAQRCASDAWSERVRVCMNEARDRDAWIACRDKMTKTQAATFAAGIERLATATTVVAKRPPSPPADAGDAAAARDLALVIEVHTDGTFAAGGKPIADADLDALFRATAAHDRETQVVLRAAPGVAHGIVVGLLERAKQAGLTRLAVGTATAP